jgi:hypothetical protein
LVSNMAGVYSAPASIAFAAGSAMNRGLSGKQASRQIISEALPLPSAAPIEDIANTAVDIYQGQSPKIPRGAYPAILRDLFNVGAPEPQAATKFRGMPSFSSRRRGQ